MSNNANKAIVAKPKVTGGLLVAPEGTDLPTDEEETLDPAFKAVGYITEDGVTRSTSRETAVKKAWGGDTIVVAQTGVDATLKTTLAEYLTKLTQELIYGAANVTETPATSTEGTKLAVVGKLGAPSPKNAWVVEMFSGRATGRIVFPIVQITENDDVTYKDDELAAHGVTATLFPDTDGNYFYEFWDDGVTTS